MLQYCTLSCSVVYPHHLSFLFTSTTLHNASFSYVFIILGFLFPSKVHFKFQSLWSSQIITWFLEFDLSKILDLLDKSESGCAFFVYSVENEVILWLKLTFIWWVCTARFLVNIWSQTYTSMTDNFFNCEIHILSVNFIIFKTNYLAEISSANVIFDTVDVTWNAFIELW